MKILGSDYDGTLNHNGIDDAKRQAIRKWRDQGNVFAIVSGRSLMDLLRVCRENTIECDYLICSNGAIVAKADGTVVSSVTCSSDLAAPLLKHVFENECLYAFVTTNTPHLIRPDEGVCDQNGNYTHDVLRELPQFNQVSAKFANPEIAERVTASLRAQFGDVLNPLQNAVFIDIVRADMNKTKGLYILMELLGAAYEDVIAVGDNVNDMDMIKEFYSYAMESGVDGSKKFADHLTSSVTVLIEREVSLR